MRYLYGDSTPFPYDFDFLLTLGAFMTAATRVVQLDAESQAHARQLTALSQERVRGIEAVQELHNQLLASMNQIVPPPGSELATAEVLHTAAVDYARKIKDYSARVTNEQRHQDKELTEREGAKLLSDNDRRMVETKAALDQFFKVAILPVLSSRTSLKLLEGKDREARYEVGVVFRNLGDIVTSYLLSSANSSTWSAPRRVGDLVSDFNLLVGAKKKSFFKSEITPEHVHLDDYIIARADVHDRGCEIAVRKKNETKEAYVFRIAKSDKGIAGEVERLEDPAARVLPPGLDRDDATRIDQLAQAIRSSLADLYQDREAVVRVEVESKDVYKNRLALNVVSRLVRTFAPIVEEIATRSPSQQELSLKLENDQGKREEVYLRRDELLNKLAPLNADGRGIFAPLGLDDWVPTLTLAPPDIIEDE